MSFPVAPGPFAARVLALVWATGLAAVTAWALLTAAPAWQKSSAFLLVAGCGLAARRSRARAPRGTLAWDGQDWHWVAHGGAPQPGRIERALDLQSRLLVRWHPTHGRTLWLWVERDAAPLHWNALRRAAHARAARNAPAAARPPIAEP